MGPEFKFDINRIEFLEEHTKIQCQNCYTTLATLKGNMLEYNPSEVQTMTQSLNDDEILMTLQCSECDCRVQIIV
jgi:hypothetical protein